MIVAISQGKRLIALWLCQHVFACTTIMAQGACRLPAVHRLSPAAGMINAGALLAVRISYWKRAA